MTATTWNPSRAGVTMGSNETAPHSERRAEVLLDGPALVPGHMQVLAVRVDEDLDARSDRGPSEPHGPTRRGLVSVHPNPRSLAIRRADRVPIDIGGAIDDDAAEHERVARERTDQERRDQRRLDRNRLLPLGRLRELSGLSLRDAARRIGVPPGLLRSWEEQRAVPSAGALDAMIGLYATGLDDLLGPRELLESPDRPGVLLVGGTSIDTNRIRERIPDVTECNRWILTEYLDAVRRSRRHGDGDRPALRSQDLMHLARVLDVSDHDLDQLLADVLDTPANVAERTGRALMVAGLMNASILIDGDQEWMTTPGTPTSDLTGNDDPPTSLFATVMGSSPTAALRKQVFSTIGPPADVDDRITGDAPSEVPVFRP